VGGWIGKVAVSVAAECGSAATKRNDLRGAVGLQLADSEAGIDRPVGVTLGDGTVGRTQQEHD
jgi:hypothetical protein